MKRVTVAVLAVWFLVCLAGVRPAAAVINSYRLILSGATYAVAAAPGAIYAGVVNGVKKSVNGGATWTQLSGLTAKTSGLAVDPKNPSIVYAATAAGLFRSINFGEDWTLINAAVRNVVIVSPTNSNVLFADNLKSADGGLTWRPMTFLSTSNTQLPLPNSPRFDIACSSDLANPGLMLASINETSFRSADGGETWQYFFRDVDSVAIDPVDARFYYLGGRCGREIQRFYPGGSAWVGPDHVHGLAVDPANHARVFAVTDDGTAAFGTNFGATWRPDTLPRIPFTSNGNTYYYTFVPFEGRTIFDAATGMVLVAGNYGLAAKNSWCPDADNDGYSPAGGVCGPWDCNDANALINPGVRENCLDNIDSNCDGNVVDMLDAYCIANCSDIDGDGFLPACGGGIAPNIDCMPKDASVYPGAPELCDWKDNDCDRIYDEDQPDLDGDGYSSCHESDCNDTDATIFPGATETPRDGVDQDCNGYDLTIKITKASYSPEQHGALHVRATSAFGPDAWLDTYYYGSLHWELKKGYWEFVMTDIGDNPGSVMVCGFEGCAEAPVVK